MHFPVGSISDRTFTASWFERRGVAARLTIRVLRTSSLGGANGSARSAARW